MINKGRLFLSYFLITNCFLAFLYGWLMTSTGLHLTLNGLSYWLPGVLMVEKAEGCLLGPMRIQQLSYVSEALEFKLGSLNVDLNKKLLLKGKLSIKQIAIEKLAIYNQATTQDGSFNIIPLLERIELHEAYVNQCQIKTAHGVVKVEGAIAEHQKLHVLLEGAGVKLTGEIKKYFTEKTYIELIAHTTPFVLQDKKIPALKITAHSQEGLNCKMITIDPEKPVNQVQFKLSKVIPSSLLGNTLLKCSLNARCKDFSILELIGFPLRDYPLTPSSGPMKIDVLLQDRFKHLKRYFNPSQDFLWGKYLYHSLPQKASLSITWKDVHLLPWGSFDSFALQGRLHQKRLLWNIQLIEKLNTASNAVPAKWYLKGETQCFYKKIKQLKQIFTHSKLLQTATSLNLRGDPLTLFKNTNYPLSAIPQIDIAIKDNRFTLLGAINIEKAHFKLANPTARVQPDSDICFTHADKSMLSNAPAFEMQLALNLGKNVYLDYSGLYAHLGGALLLSQKDGQGISAKGEIKIVEGGYHSFGQRLNLSKNSRLIFKERFYNPTLDVEATRLMDTKFSNQAVLSPASNIARSGLDYSFYSTNDLKLPIKTMVGLHLQGDLMAPSMCLFARPVGWITSPKDRLSYLITGQSARHIDGNPLPLLINIASQIAYGYFYDDSKTPHALKPISIAVNQEIEKNKISYRCLFNYQYDANTHLTWKVGRLGASHAIGIHRLINDHITVGGSVGLLNAASGLELGYQYEWD